MIPRTQRAYRWARRGWLLALPTACALAGLSSEPLQALDFHAALVGSAPAALMAASLRLGVAAAAFTARQAWMLGASGALAPALLLWAAGSWVPSCDASTGAVFWLLGPLSAAVVSAAMASVALALLPARPWAAWTSLVLASALAPLWRFAAGPTLGSWHVLLGRIPAALYEDAIAPDARHWAFRAATLAPWLAAAAWAEAVRAAHTDGRSWWRTSPRRCLPWLAGAVAMVGAGVAWWAGPVYGFRIDRQTLEQALPVRWELRLDPAAAAAAPADAPPDVVVHLAALPGWQQRAPALVEDIAFRWRSLAAQLGTRPAGATEVFVYADDDQKEALVGARAVEMAKPWLRQVHLVAPPYGASILTHELAHVFGAAWIDNPWGVPFRGVVPDAVRIEGLAVALEWPEEGGLDPHDQAGAMRALGLAPSWRELASPLGFALENPRRAYTIGGSLLRFVADHCGVEALREVYRGAAPAAACGAGDLEARWAQWVDDRATALDPSVLERYRARFEAPGLLRRPCPLATGRCAARVARLHHQRRDHEAVAQWRSLREALLPHLAGGQLPLGLDLAWAAALVRASDLASASAVIEARLASTRRALDHALLADAWGDVALTRGDLAAAGEAWRRARAGPLSEARLRLIDLKVALAPAREGREAIAALWALGGRAGPIEPVLERLRGAPATAALGAYLVARQRLAEAPDDVQAAASLVGLLSGPAPLPATLVRAALRDVGVAAARRGWCGALAPLPWALGADAASWAWVAALRRRCAGLLALGPPARWARRVEARGR